MGWVRLDDAFYDHQKFIEAGPLAGWLWVCSLAWSNRNLTDGFIPANQVPRLASFDGFAHHMWSGELMGGGEDVDVRDLAGDLVSLRLWDEVEGGYRIHDFHDYQPSAEQVLAKREKERSRWSRRSRGNAAGAAHNGTAPPALADNSGGDSTPDSTAESPPEYAPTPVVPNPKETGTSYQCADGADPPPLRAVESPAEEHQELPLRADEGLSYTRTVAGWLRLQGVSVPARNRRDEAYAVIVNHVDRMLGRDHPKRTWALLRIVADYVEDVTGDEVNRDAQNHLGRLVKNYGPGAAMHGMAEAVKWGAGIGTKFADDPLAITKYATSVCAKAAS